MAAIIGTGPGQYIFVPVCERCWRHPSHRKVNIDGHFWPHSEAKRYVELLRRKNFYDNI